MGMLETGPVLSGCMTGWLVAVFLGGLTMAGLMWRHYRGRFHPTGVSTVEDSPQLLSKTDQRFWKSIGVDPGSAVLTLVQFSSAFCQPCRATRLILGQVVTELPQLKHVEVDAESHLAAVRTLGIWRTPTTLLIDQHGRVVERAVGQPQFAHVVATVAPYLPGQ